MRKLAPVTLVLMLLASFARAADTSTLDLGEGVSLELILVKAGTFTMGSPAGEKGRRADEAPHEVKIAADFYLGKTPVTRGQFARFVADANYKTEAETGTSGGYGVVDGALVQRKDFTWKNPGFAQTDDHPVVLVTVNDANAFIAWLAKRSNQRISLPTEAQFEYATRAGTATRFYAGDDDQNADSMAWFKDNAKSTTHGVGEKAANAWGLLDMSGNVFQWCSDTYAAYPGGETGGDMTQPRIVLRAGSFLRGINDVRSAARYRNSPTSRNADNGFRIAMAVPPPPPPAPLPSIEIDNRSHGQSTPPQNIVAPARMMATAEPVAAYAVSFSPTSSLVGLVCSAIPCILLIVIIALVVRAVTRAAGKSTPSGPNPSHSGGPRTVPHRVQQDGFWIDTASFRPGEAVRYRYAGPNGAVVDQFVVQPNTGEQFIYTGFTPSDILIIGLVNQSIQNQQRPIPRSTYDDDIDITPITPHHTDHGSSSHSSGFSGFPSAY